MERQELSTTVNHRDTVARLEKSLAAVRSRIAGAARRGGREPTEVRLVAVTKGVETDVVRLAATAGIEEFGENYVQELESKRDAAPDAIWHFIGKLQSNKVRRVLESAAVVETLEPGRAADHLLELAADRPEAPACLIEVDFTGGRVGVTPEALPAFAEALAAGGVEPAGLMAVAPADQDPRPSFRRLRELRDSLRSRFESVTELSMGMSTDLEVAVEEGATMVRVGTAIFGPRARR